MKRLLLGVLLYAPFAVFAQEREENLVMRDKNKQEALRNVENKHLEEGQLAPNFSQKDPNGKDISLSSFRGKYVLVDFWASWCGPCRRENPYVVKAYERFKDKNFTILGVSLDNSKDAWLKAIKADKLTWTHVSDLKGWKNEVAVLYSVRSIPTNYLLDPDGRIIAKNLRGSDLEKVLAEHLK